MSFYTSKHSSVRSRGTTLIEILVVIVVFLIGILAVAQIFPNGFKILDRTRDSLAATALARGEVERLKSLGDELPDRIVPIQYVGGIVVEDPTRTPFEFSPSPSALSLSGPIAGIQTSGLVTTGGTDHRWQYLAGANAIRRVIGETHRMKVPTFMSPSQNDTSDPYGCVVIAAYGPMELQSLAPSSELLVYGRDLLQRLGSVPVTGLGEFEYYLENADNGAARINLLQTGTSAAGTIWRVSAALLIDTGTGRKRVQATARYQSATGPVTSGQLSAIFTGVIGSGTLLSVEPSSVQVSRIFEQIATTAGFTDPYQFKLVNPKLGIFCFSPLAYDKYEQRPGSIRTPLEAKIDYTVKDWRILREDFRLSASAVDPNSGDAPVGVSGYKVTNNLFKTAIPQIKATSDTGPDLLKEPSLEDDAVVQDLIPDVYAATQVGTSDNLAIIDLTTGCVLSEIGSISVNKTTGLITFNSLPYDSAIPTGIVANLMTSVGQLRRVDLTNRPLRVIYKGKKQWAVQLTKSSSRYTPSTILASGPASGQFYIGGSDSARAGLPTRLYFPQMDAGQKISIGRIRYIDSGGREQFLEGANFVVRFNAAGDTINPPLPSLDIHDVVPDAQSFSTAAEYPVENVQGASAKVRVFWNPNFFSLGTGTADNLNIKFRDWAQQLNVTTKETFLSKGESIH